MADVGKRNSGKRFGGKYSCFAELMENETEDVDYIIYVRSGYTGIAIMAPHGGDIEPGTSELAKAIAANEHTCYSFEGAKPSGNRFLHISSTLFDEPRGVRVAEESLLALTIHGCTGDHEAVYLGGLHVPAVPGIESALTKAGYNVSAREGLEGISTRNICNRNSNALGVQLELSTALRMTMFRDLTRDGRETPTADFHRFVAILRNILSGNHTEWIGVNGR